MISHCLSLICTKIGPFHLFQHHLTTFKFGLLLESNATISRFCVLCDQYLDVFFLIPNAWWNYSDKSKPKFNMTQNRLMVAFDSQKGPNLKVVKWCWKGWNGPILVHIYDKQCEIIQKIQWKSSNFQFQCFYKGTSGALCWKRRKTPKLGKLKYPLLNFFK